MVDGSRPTLTLVQAIPPLEPLCPLQCPKESMQRRSHPVLRPFQSDCSWIVVGPQPNESTVERHGCRDTHSHQADHHQRCQQKSEEEFEHSGQGECLARGGVDSKAESSDVGPGNCDARSLNASIAGSDAYVLYGPFDSVKSNPATCRMCVIWVATILSH